MSEIISLETVMTIVIVTSELQAILVNSKNSNISHLVQKIMNPIKSVLVKLKSKVQTAIGQCKYHSQTIILLKVLKEVKEMKHT